MDLELVIAIIAGLLTLIFAIVWLRCWPWRRRRSDKVTTTPQSRSRPPPAEPAQYRKIGIAIVIANDGENIKKLHGVKRDKERWEEVFRELEFDVRTSRTVGWNASKEEMLELCKLPNKIHIG